MAGLPPLHAETVTVAEALPVTAVGVPGAPGGPGMTADVAEGEPEVPGVLWDEVIHVVFLSRIRIAPGFIITCEPGLRRVQRMAREQVALLVAVQRVAKNRQTSRKSSSSLGAPARQDRRSSNAVSFADAHGLSIAWGECRPFRCWVHASRPGTT